MNAWLKLWQDLGPIGASVVAVIGMIAAYLFLRRVVLSRLQRLAEATTNDLDDRLVQFFQQFLWLIMFFAGAVAVLHINGIAVSPLLAGAGIVGIAVGFAAKETLADVLSGVLLIADRPLRLGDRVKIEHIGRHWGEWGDVVDIGLRRTRIRNTDGVVVNYPNSVLSNSVITNFSYDISPLRVRIRFQVDYGADITLVKRIALEAIRAVPEVIPGTEEVLIRSLWDDNQGHLMSGVLLEGRYRIADVRKRTQIRAAVLEGLLATLREHQIPLAAQPIRMLPSEP